MILKKKECYKSIYTQGNFFVIVRLQYFLGNNRNFIDMQLPILSTWGAVVNHRMINSFFFSNLGRGFITQSISLLGFFC